MLPSDSAVPLAGSGEPAAALLQAAITVGLAVLCAQLYRRYQKPYLRWWAVAWSLYALRLAAIITFLRTGGSGWLYWHQAITGWTALVLLWTALVFSRQPRWRSWYLILVLFPPAWAFVAIYGLDRFMLVAVPAVIFLSIATLWTGWVFYRDHRDTGSTGSAILASAFGLWGLHHLDYPLLRARGALNPWSYYLDICFMLAVATGLLTLVLEDTRRGLAALSALSDGLAEAADGSPVDALLAGAASLRGVRGSAMYSGEERRFVRGNGACASWVGQIPSGAAADAVDEALASGRPKLSAGWSATDAPGGPYPWAAVLPVLQGQAPAAALVIVSAARDPFTAVDERFLRAFGRQAGAALERADLALRLRQRTADLERLSARMVRQHEEERRRLSLELHDETAQVFAAVKMQLGVAREQAGPELASRLDRSLELVDTGLHSIRRVTDSLRPALLDDIGLVPALRSLVADFREQSGLSIVVQVPDHAPILNADADVALFRALQEGLANVARHAAAVQVRVELTTDGTDVTLRIRDDGVGLDLGVLAGKARQGHAGLVGMRERVETLGGAVEIVSVPGGGLQLSIRLPEVSAA
ncbi:MAG: GAF domain-containing sensor histidine kinase [Gemmatimonadota bacterium]